MGFGANRENSRCFGTRKLGLMTSVWDLGHGEEILMGFEGGGLYGMTVVWGWGIWREIGEIWGFCPQKYQFGIWGCDPFGVWGKMRGIWGTELK